MAVPLAKALFSAIALGLTFAAFLPYIHAILRRKARPHVFSWFIWATGTFVVFTAQLADGAGIGAWPIGISSGLTLSVALLALWRMADRSIARIDWLFLTLALSALPLWFFTSTPLSAVIVLTAVDLLGFGPSLRKAYAFPHEESPLFFGTGALRNGFVIAALEHYSWTTALFPAAVGAACLIFVALILVRRRNVPMTGLPSAGTGSRDRPPRPSPSS